MDWSAWHIAGWMVAVLVPLALRRWVLIDRAKLRRRCPRCWYGMAGVPATVKGARSVWVCPECTHSARSERDLLRNRARVGRVWAVLLGAVLGYGLWVVPRVKSEGAAGVIPTTVLAMSVAGPQEGGNPFWVSTRDLAARRLDQGWAWQQSLAAFKSRVEYWGRGRLLSPESAMDAQVLEVYDASGFVGGWKEYKVARWCCGVVPPPPDEFHERLWREERDEVVDLITSTVEPDAWDVNGGQYASLTSFGTRLLVLAPPSVHEKVREVVGLLKTPAGQACPRVAFHLTVSGQVGGSTMSAFDVDDLVVAERPLENAPLGRVSRSDRETIQDICDIITSLITTEDWTCNGGDMSSIRTYRHRVFVKGPPATVDKVGKLIEHLRTPASASDHMVHTPELDAACAGDFSAGRFVAMHDVQDIYGRAVQLSYNIVDGEPQGRCYGREEVLSDVREIITGTIEPDTWSDNGGEEASCRWFGTRLIIQAPARTQVQVVGLLGLLRDREAARIHLKGSWRGFSTAPPRGAAEP
ncbi:MAG TPA: hypothetical protein VD997_15335 [Phycisphaerales bacterium]|nr:hypothetical protein [Phycisphaerales bacterium]